jgi:8-oxo-dGTP pyrophosphatase MutT (NUDIX family)
VGADSKGENRKMEEYFAIAGPRDPEDQNSEIIIAGCVTRNLAHGPARIPHATVHLIPVRCGTRNVFIHKRSLRPRNAPGKWGFFGGHVSFEMGMLSATSGLGEASWITALREAREEIPITVHGSTHLIQRADLEQVGDVGQFRWGINDHSLKNVEYSTAFVLSIPEDGIIDSSPFELYNGGVESLEVKEIPWDELRNVYQASKSIPPADLFNRSKFHQGFADDVARILDQVAVSDELCREFETAFSRCKVQAK